MRQEIIAAGGTPPPAELAPSLPTAISDQDHDRLRDPVQQAAYARVRNVGGPARWVRRDQLKE